MPFFITNKPKLFRVSGQSELHEGLYYKAMIYTSILFKKASTNYEYRNTKHK